MQTKSRSEVLGLGLQHILWGDTVQPVWRRAGGRASPAAWHPTSPVCSSAEPGGRAAQGEAGPGLRGEVGRQPDNGGSSPAPDAMPQVRGLPADRVRRVPLLQGHEEVRRPRADEAELHHAPVHRGECAAPRPSSRRAGPASLRGGRFVPLLKEDVPAADRPGDAPLGRKGAQRRADSDPAWRTPRRCVRSGS